MYCRNMTVYVYVSSNQDTVMRILIISVVSKVTYNVRNLRI